MVDAAPGEATLPRHPHLGIETVALPRAAATHADPRARAVPADALRRWTTSLPRRRQRLRGRTAHRDHRSVGRAARKRRGRRPAPDAAHVLSRGAARRRGGGHALGRHEDGRLSRSADDDDTTVGLVAAHRALESRRGRRGGEDLLRARAARPPLRHTDRPGPARDRDRHGPGGGARAARRSRGGARRPRRSSPPSPGSAASTSSAPSSAGTALTPFAYQRHQRIEKARAVLRTGVSLAEAAADAGFADQIAPRPYASGRSWARPPASTASPTCAARADRQRARRGAPAPRARRRAHAEQPRPDRRRGPEGDRSSRRSGAAAGAASSGGAAAKKACSRSSKAAGARSASRVGLRLLPRERRLLGRDLRWLREGDVSSSHSRSTERPPDRTPRKLRELSDPARARPLGAEVRSAD